MSRWERFDNPSSWRKISVGLWSNPKDPSIYGLQTVEVTEALAYLDEAREHTEQKLTFTHLFISAVAKVLEENPKLNTIVLGNRVLKRKHVDIFCQVAVDSEDPEDVDLSGVRIKDADDRNLSNIAAQLGGQAAKIRTGEDEQVEQTKSMVDWTPPFLRRIMIKFVEWLSFVVPIDFSSIGIPNDLFGSAMISSIGQLGLDQGFGALVPSSRCPMILVPGRIQDMVFAKDGEPVVRKGVTISGTFDHRCFDGYELATLVKALRAKIEKPREHFPPPEEFVAEGLSEQDAQE